MSKAGGQKPGRVVAFKPEARRLEETIREIACVTAQVGFTDHALDRMHERGITDRDVYAALRQGFVEANSIEPGAQPGEQICKVTKAIKGARDIGVITAVVRDQSVIVITVQWEDLT